MAEGSGGTTPPPDPPTKPEASGAAKILSIKIVDQQEVETIFRIKTITKLHKVFKSYSERRQIDIKSVRFMFHGSRIQDEETPEILDMKDGDTVQAMVEQLGGGADDAPTPGDANSEHAGPKYLNVKVVDQNQNEIFFKIKEHTLLKKVMDAYCERQGVVRDTVRFLIEGERINDHDTPLSKEMEDGDMIQVARFQEGGASEGDNEAKEEKINDRINLVVKMGPRTEQTFKVKMGTLMSKLMDGYCGYLGREPKTLRFFTPDGKRINEKDTPTSLELEDGDQLDAHEEQQGGALQAATERDIRFKVVESVTGQAVYYTMKNTTKMGKLMSSYEQRMSLPHRSGKFYINGELITRHVIPMVLHLSNYVTVRVEFPKGHGFLEKGYVNFCVNDVLGTNKCWFKTKSTTSMGKVMTVYRERVGETDLRFETSSGAEIQPTDTPRSLKIQAVGHINCSYVDMGKVVKVFEEILAVIDLPDESEASMAIVQSCED